MVLRAGEMQTKYGLTAENRPTIRLDPSKVPLSVRDLIPLAEHFGIGDDLIRADVIAHTPKPALLELSNQVNLQRSAFNRSLAGPEADGPDFSDEYVAFSCLKMAAGGY